MNPDPTSPPPSGGRKSLPAIFLFFLLFGTSTLSHSVASSPYIPPELTAWKPWVLHGQEDHACAHSCNDPDRYFCVWPSRLRMTVEPSTGSFELEVIADRDSRIIIPGSPEAYPRQVTCNGIPCPVVLADQTPSVWVSPGRYRITGTFQWKEAPETIAIPPQTGIVSLQINGRSVDQPRIDPSGRLWIQKRFASAKTENRMDIRIFRRITDSIPMMVTQRIQLDISGQPREIVLPNVLLPAAVATRLLSPFPARIGPDNYLTIQARPGRYLLEIDTRFESPVAEIQAGNREYGEEIWSFEARNHLRMVNVLGAPSIDPGRADVPPEWKNFPAYLVSSGTVLRFAQVRRGDADPAPDQVNLFRTWWLDFDGNGYTVHDRLTGTISRRWSLFLQEPGELGKVSVDGVDQLITAQGPEDRPGVELRKGRLQLEADSRLDGPFREIPAVGWDTGVQRASGKLNLPPGWKLFAAGGVDILPGTWIGRWTLLDLFLVLIISVSLYRLKSPLWGGLCLLTLVLIYHQPDSPRLTWLSLLAASASLRVLPEGWIRKLAVSWKALSVIALLGTAIPFLVQEVRVGLYPQLERPYTGQPAADKTQPRMKEEAQLADMAAGGGEAVSRRMLALPSAQAPEKKDRYSGSLAQDPNALIQTGPGLPTWKWHSYDLRWNGPVQPDHTIRLILLSPLVNLLLSALRVILSVCLLFGMIDFRAWTGRLSAGLLPAAVFLAVGLTSASLVSWGYCQTGHPDVQPGKHALAAAFPPQELLQELQNRLLARPDCLPFCADIPFMEIHAAPNDLTIRCEIHAVVSAAIPLPSASLNWRPSSVLLNQTPASGLVTDPSGVLWVLVPAGIHHLTLAGPTNSTDRILLALPIKPRRITTSATGWHIQGLQPDGQVSAGIQILREHASEGPEKPGSTGILPSFFHIERTLRLAVTWEVQTTVTRICPENVPMAVGVPLLNGEMLTTPGIHVQQGNAMVTLDPSENQVVLHSRMEPRETIHLEAPQSVPWTETWILEASPIWHCELSGIPMVHHMDPGGIWRPEWRPWPGESAEIRVIRPRAIPGPIVTIDSASVQLTPGNRMDRAEMTMMIRTSRGGQHIVRLPPGGVLQQVHIQNESQPIRQQDREVAIPLEPGLQKVVLEWHTPMESRFRYRAPAVSPGDQAVNAAVTIQMPSQRWILWTSGPRMGPAVLFWGYLVVILLLGAGLGKTTLTPLRTRHWVLLGMGLTQVHPWIALLVVGWLLALGYRNLHPPTGGWFSFNLVQLIFIGWTLAAMSGLYLAVQNGLLGIPEMQIMGNGSTSRMLKWTQDRIGATMPEPMVISLPDWIFHGFMLVWSLWLAVSLLAWLKWGWGCISKGGFWKPANIRWRKRPRNAEIGKDTPE